MSQKCIYIALNKRSNLYLFWFLKKIFFLGLFFRLFQTQLLKQFEEHKTQAIEKFFQKFQNFFF